MSKNSCKRNTMPPRRAVSYSIRQQNPIFQPKVNGLLQRVRNKTSVVIRWASSDQWPRWSRKQSHLNWAVQIAKGKWVKVLLAVLWSHHTTVQTATLETPFRLTYSYDAMIPIEISIPSSWMQSFDPEKNEQEMWAELDTLDEVRQVARIRKVFTKARASQEI
jgi:hypothetical protein